MSNKDKRKELERISNTLLSRFANDREMVGIVRGWVFLWTVLPDIGIEEAYRTIYPKLLQIEAMSMPRVEA